MEIIYIYIYIVPYSTNIVNGKTTFHGHCDEIIFIKKQKAKKRKEKTERKNHAYSVVPSFERGRLLRHRLRTRHR